MSISSSIHNNGDVPTKVTLNPRFFDTVFYTSPDYDFCGIMKVPKERSDLSYHNV